MHSGSLKVQDDGIKWVGRAARNSWGLEVMVEGVRADRHSEVWRDYECMVKVMILC